MQKIFVFILKVLKLKFNNYKYWKKIDWEIDFKNNLIIENILKI